METIADKVRRIVHRYAPKLGLDPDKIEVIEIVGTGMDYDSVHLAQSNYSDGIGRIIVNGSAITEAALAMERFGVSLQRILEGVTVHELAHIADMKEGLYTSRVYAFIGIPSLTAACKTLAHIAADLLCFRRIVSVFGRESLIYFEFPEENSRLVAMVMTLLPESLKDMDNDRRYFTTLMTFKNVLNVVAVDYVAGLGWRPYVPGYLAAALIVRGIATAIELGENWDEVTKLTSLLSVLLNALIINYSVLYDNLVTLYTMYELVKTGKSAMRKTACSKIGVDYEKALLVLQSVENAIHDALTALRSEIRAVPTAL